jgi:hypothetical protein
VSSLLANLAAAPFVNQRPVQRFKLVAWLLGALLASVNVLLWLQYRHDSTALRARLAETRVAIEARSGSVVAMDRELDSLDLSTQNAQVEFLNRRIAERTFPWSLLFERIASTLPDGVRLFGLSPVFQDRERMAGATPAKRTAPQDELVGLKIIGVAKSDDELYQLIDTFFSSPAFERPRLYQERITAGEVQFTIDVEYRPRFETAAARMPIGPTDPGAALIGPPHGSLESSEPLHRPAAAAAEPVGAEEAGAADSEVGE